MSIQQTASPTDPIYSNYTAGGAPANVVGINPSGFKAQPIQDNNPMANFLGSTQNLAAGAGSSAISTGVKTAKTGTDSLSPVLDYLTKLTKGDQADVSQAIQPEADRIRDSFAAVRNLISSQPRGGGKAGQLAESGFDEQSKIADVASKARTGAVGELGSLGTTLTGLGTQEIGVGAGLLNDSATSALTQRAQNFGPGSTAAKFGQYAQAISALI